MKRRRYGQDDHEALEGRRAPGAPQPDGGAAGPAGTLLRLQRTAGNLAARSLIAGAQAKLDVGAAGDRYEREADDVARQVVATLRGGGRGSRAVDDERGPTVARSVQRRGPIGADGGTVDPDTERAVDSARGRGSSLDGRTRSSMESAFGADFSGVRVHAGPEADELASRMQASAFTIGSDIFFRGGVPDTATASGQELLAHELTHTIQQSGSARRTIRRDFYVEADNAKGWEAVADSAWKEGAFVRSERQPFWLRTLYKRVPVEEPAPTPSAPESKPKSAPAVGGKGKGRKGGTGGKGPRGGPRRGFGSGPMTTKGSGSKSPSIVEAVVEAPTLEEAELEAEEATDPTPTTAPEKPGPAKLPEGLEAFQSAYDSLQPESVRAEADVLLKQYSSLKDKRKRQQFRTMFRGWLDEHATAEVAEEAEAEAEAVVVPARVNPDQVTTVAELAMYDVNREFPAWVRAAENLTKTDGSVKLVVENPEGERLPNNSGDAAKDTIEVRAHLERNGRRVARSRFVVHYHPNAQKATVGSAWASQVHLKATIGSKIRSYSIPDTWKDIPSFGKIKRAHR